MIGTPRGGTRFHELGAPERPINDLPSTVVRMVAPGYFGTLRIPVLRGREFTDADNANPMAGFVVNETFARSHLSGRDPLAASISVRMQDENPYLPILGVVGEVSEWSVRVPRRPTVFYSHGRMPWATMTLFRARTPTRVARQAGHRGTARARAGAGCLGRSHDRARDGRESGARTHQRALLDELRCRGSAAGDARTLRLARLTSKRLSWAQS